jgi:hypothetical protein
MENKISLRGFAVGIYLFSVPVFSFSGELGLNAIPQLIGAALVLYALADIVLTGEIRRNVPLMLYMLFALWSIVPGVFGDYTNETGHMNTLLKVMMITAAVSVLVKHKTDFIISLGLFFASIFITIWLNLDDLMMLRTSAEITGTDRFAGTFANANTAAMFAMTIIWSGFTLLMISRKSALTTPFIILGILLAIMLVIYSGSKKGYLGLALFGLLAAWLVIRKPRKSFMGRIATYFAVAAALSGVMYVLYTSPFFYRVQTMFDEQYSTDSRMYLFQRALFVWGSSPKNFLMGVGLGNFQFYNYLHVYSHSTVAETLACTGLTGFLLYFSSLGSMFILYGKALRVLPPDNRTQVWLVFIMLVLILFFNVTAVLYSSRIFWPLLGIISARGVTLLQTDAPDRPGIVPYRLSYIT